MRIALKTDTAIERNADGDISWPETYADFKRVETIRLSKVPDCANPDWRGATIFFGHLMGCTGICPAYKRMANGKDTGGTSPKMEVHTKGRQLNKTADAFPEKYYQAENRSGLAYFTGDMKNPMLTRRVHALTMQAFVREVSRTYRGLLPYMADRVKGGMESGVNMKSSARRRVMCHEALRAWIAFGNLLMADCYFCAITMRNKARGRFI